MKIANINTITALMLKRIWNEKRAFLLVIVAPIVVSTTFGYVVYKHPHSFNTLIVTESVQNEQAYRETGQIISRIDNYRATDGSAPFSVTSGHSQTKALQFLDNGDVRAVILMNHWNSEYRSVETVVDVTEPAVSGLFEQDLQLIFNKYSNELSGKLINDYQTQKKRLSLESSPSDGEQGIPQYTTTVSTNGWKELKFIDFFASGIIVLVGLGLPLLVSSLSLTWDRSLGTLERIFASPYRKSEVILGKMLAYSMLALVVAILIIITFKILFDITVGNLGLVLLVTVLSAINGVIFGVLISAITDNVVESLLWAIMALSLFMILMANIWPWEAMHTVGKYMSYAIPYTYGVQAMRKINMINAGFGEIWGYILISLGFIAVQALVAIQVLKRQVT